MFDKLPIVTRMTALIRADPILMGVAIVAAIIVIAVVVCLMETRAVTR